jgi:hypothetical protein
VRKKDKPGDAVGRPRWGSSLLSDPGAKFFCGKRGPAQNKKNGRSAYAPPQEFELSRLLTSRGRRGAVA